MQLYDLIQKGVEACAASRCQAPRAVIQAHPPIPAAVAAAAGLFTDPISVKTSIA